MIIFKKLLTSDLVQHLRDYCPLKGGGFYVKFYILSQILSNPDYIDKTPKHIKKSLGISKSAISDTLEFLKEQNISTPDDITGFCDSLSEEDLDDSITVSITPPEDTPFNISHDELMFFKKELYNYKTVFILAKRLKQYSPPCDDFELICRIAKCIDDKSLTDFDELKKYIFEN